MLSHADVSNEVARRECVSERQKQNIMRPTRRGRGCGGERGYTLGSAAAAATAAATSLWLFPSKSHSLSKRKEVRQVKLPTRPRLVEIRVATLIFRR